MAIIITKYENSTDGDIVFDTSVFDYRFDSDDTFGSDLKTDVETILEEEGTDYTITRQTTTTDGYGYVTVVSDETFTATAFIFDIAKEDLELADMGLAVKGTKKGYFQEIYVDGGTDWEVKEGDILTDESSRDWRIVKVASEHIVSKETEYKGFKTIWMTKIMLGGV